MKEMLRYGLILSLICVIASGLLAVVYSLAQPKIIAQAREDEEAALRGVMPQGERFIPVKEGEETLYYKVSDKDGNFLGVAFKASGDGYSSEIEAMAGLSKDGAITKIKILSQNETPGLGTRVTEPSFLGQFTGKNLRGLNEVQAITGATISSTAVIAAVKEKAERVEKWLKNER